MNVHAEIPLLVTAHAALRWLERFVGVDTGRIARDTGYAGFALAGEAARAAGLTLDAVRERLSSPEIRGAARLGASRVPLDGGLLILTATDEPGQVAVVTFRLDRRGHGIRLPTRRESRRSGAAATRKARRGKCRWKGEGKREARAANDRGREAAAGETGNSGRRYGGDDGEA
ncbi:MAG: hypothetical protein AB7L41_15510 [Flavobacteriaceae bacterium]